MARSFKILFLILVLNIYAAASDVFSAEKHECGYCHLTSDKTRLRASLAELCIVCHSDAKDQKQHRVGMVPSMKVDELPLSSDGKMTCITCHDPHGKSGYVNLLRTSPEKLCSKCHIK